MVQLSNNLVPQEKLPSVFNQTLGMNGKCSLHAWLRSICSERIQSQQWKLGFCNCPSGFPKSIDSWKDELPNPTVKVHQDI